MSDACMLRFDDRTGAVRLVKSLLRNIPIDSVLKLAFHGWAYAWKAGREGGSGQLELCVCGRQGQRAADTATGAVQSDATRLATASCSRGAEEEDGLQVGRALDRHTALS